MSTMSSKEIQVAGHDSDPVLERQYGHDDTEKAMDSELAAGTEIGNGGQDQNDMKRLGKRQEFRRNFGFIASMGFSAVFSGTWELVIIVLSAGVYNGGFAGLFWAFLGTCIVYAPIVASLSEMGSMAPQSGGQYHWVSEFAPPAHQKVLSYASGWMTTLAWVATQTSSPFLTVTLIQVMINTTMPDFEFTSWQYTLLMLGVLLTLVFVNTWAASILPWLESISLFGHVFGFLTVIITLWVRAPKASAREVFVTFQNEGGWNIGAAVLLNQVNSLYCILGSDVVTHISEEVYDASLVVPRAMWWSYILNFVLAVITLVTMLFCWGPIQEAIDADVPYLVLFQQTGSIGIALLDLIIISLLIYVGNVTTVASTSRETWAFARDKGLPFSRWITKMDRKRAVPFNSVYLITIISGLLCLIDLGSTLAFNIIVSLGLLALMSTYSISIGCIFYKRLRGELLPPARWSLGKHGIWINGMAFSYSIFVMVWCCFPAALPVDAASANYGPALWVLVMIFAAVFYVFYGRYHYTPPVMFVEGRKSAGVGIQHT